MSSQAERFFEGYQQALNANDAAAMTALHQTPSIFVSDQTKRVCSQVDDIRTVNQSMIDGINNAGASRCEALVNQAMRLSDSVFFVNVRWQLFDQADKKLSVCHCSYTLQRDAAGDLHIIVAVLDDEDKLFSAMLNGGVHAP
ncbi:hypothetical protein LJ739_11190 [Aestuariibacter halophilus]|uniref:SnoaL-like domain-containing protein n=1 Tax=Fluctibacter halophilus TaxID=226011 RepID=A0ABS8G9L3_9ALTE|nr:hypothetical protein [Aestuariibacter halophilus]MCC2616806.1 hypothetical protein [Aestuariibacter halophilus]